MNSKLAKFYIKTIVYQIIDIDPFLSLDEIKALLNGLNENEDIVAAIASEGYHDFDVYLKHLLKEYESDYYEKYNL